MVGITCACIADSTAFSQLMVDNLHGINNDTGTHLTYYQTPFALCIDVKTTVDDLENVPD